MMLTGVFGPSARAQRIDLEADRLEARSGELELEGHIRLQLGACQLRANSVRVDLVRRTLLGQQVELCPVSLSGSPAPGPRLWANRLRLAAGGVLEAELLQGSPCACPGGPSWLTFTARRARIARGGRRLHLRWPVLRLGPVPLLVLPYLALPLEPGVSGLLPPEVGYSGRDGLRLAQGLYLAPGQSTDLLVAAGWIQRRGAQARARLRIHGARGELSVEARGLREGEWDRGQVRGAVRLVGSGWAVGISPDLTSDPALPRVLEHDVQRVFAPHLRSRAWVWGASGAMHGHVRADLLQHLLAPSPLPHGLVGAMAAEVGIGPARLLGPATLMVDASVRHWTGIPLPGEAGFRSSRPYGALRDEAAESHHATWIQLDPAVALSDSFGPLRISMLGRYRLRAMHADGSQQSAWHAGVLGLEGSIPLARRFRGGLVHLVEPLAGIEWSGWGSATLVAPDGVELREGGTVVAGLRSELWHGGAGARRRRLSLLGRLELPLQEGVEQSLAGAQLELRGRPGSARLAGAWLVGTGRLTELEGRLCLGRWRGLMGCGGYARLRVADAADLLGSGRGEGRWLEGSVLSLTPELQPDQVFGAVDGEWGPFGAGGRVAWDPARGRLSYATLATLLSLGCGCYQVGLAGAYRAGQAWPDLMLTLAGRGGDLRCWRY